MAMTILIKYGPWPVGEQVVKVKCNIEERLYSVN